MVGKGANPEAQRPVVYLQQQPRTEKAMGEQNHSEWSDDHNGEWRGVGA